MTDITKNLAIMEDLSQGTTSEIQVRGGVSYTVRKLPVPYPVSNEAEMTALDVTAYTLARLFTGNTAKEYIYKELDVTGVPSTGAGTWVPLIDSIGDIVAIARSLNVTDSEVIYSTDTNTVLDNVLYIYHASSQVVWGKPSGVGAGETIVAVSSSTLITSGGTYTLTNVDTVNRHGTLDYFKDTTGLAIGMALRVTDRADGIFDVVSSTTVTVDGYGIVGHDTLALALVLRVTDHANVEQFGAVSGGVVPARGAFQAAIDKAELMQTVVTNTNSGGGTFTSSRIPVVIPGKDYYIEGSLKLGLYGSVKGLGRPILRGSPVGTNVSASHYIFDNRLIADGGLGEGVWQYEISGFICIWAEGAIAWDNGNRDQGDIHIHDFEVKGLNSAIYIKDAQSSNVVIENFKSDKCIYFVTNEKCDSITLQNGWISQGVLADLRQSTIRHIGGNMKVRDIIGVPISHTGTDVSWFMNGDIANLGGESSTLLSIEEFRAGGESGSCTLVNNFAKHNQTYPASVCGVVINNCQVFTVSQVTSTNGYSCAIRLFRIPNKIIVRDCTGMIDTDYWVTWWSGTAIPVGDQYTKVVAGERSQFVIDCSASDLNTDVLFARLANSASITRLFYPTYFPEASDTTATTAEYKTYIQATASGVYNISYVANPQALASGEYTQTLGGIILTSSSHDGVSIKVRPEYQELYRTTLGVTPSPSKLTLTVDMVLGDGTGATSTIDYTQVGLYYFRITVSGFESGVAGSSGVLEMEPRNIGTFNTAR